MTIAKESREENLEWAIRAMMEELGEGWFDLLFPNGQEPPYDQVLPTTWRELTNRGYLKEHGFSRYQLTSSGWLFGVRLLDLPNEPRFRDNMSSLSRTLKGYVKSTGRREDALRDVWTVARESGTSEAFVRNAIASRLLKHVFHIRDAYFPPRDQMGQVIVIPLDYGHEP